MTEPVDPTDRYLERMRLVSQREYGTEYRPGLAHIFASSDGSPQDIARIGALIRSLDIQNRVRLMRMSGAVSPTTGEQNDLLAAAKAGAESVKVAHYNQAESADSDSSWWDNVVHSVKGYFRGSGAVMQIGGDMTMEEIGKVPGFVYRVGRSGVYDNENDMAAAMKRNGYDASSEWDKIAFTWNHGESFIDNLAGAREKYGKDDVDLALELFDHGTDHESALYAYRQKLQKQYADGDIDLATAAAKIKRAEDPEFIHGAYEGLDRQHQSPGRDLARMVLPETWEDDKAFTAISGTGDTLWTLFADPTIVGEKYYRAAQISKWGIDSVNSGKIYHMLGLDDPLTGVPAPKKYTGVMGNTRRAGVEDFLGRGVEWRNARAAGDEDGAAAIYESARMAHKDMMPIWGEMNGIRPAITQAERDLAAKEGHRFVDGTGVEYPYGAIKTDPITTVEQFADWAVGPWGLMRMANGLPAHEVMMMPGRMGYWAEKRANRAMLRTLTGATDARAKGAELLDFSDENIDKITGTLREDELRRIAEARGSQLFDQATSAKRLPLKFDAMARRVSTLIPEGRELDLASAADAKIVRQWGRIYLPKWEAARMASMWESGSPATRRTLLKGLMLQTFEASGLTRSAVGRDFVDKWINDLDNLDKRRYAFGKADVIADGYSGARRSGLYPSQIETKVTLPAFSEMRQLAAKAAVMGYDPNLAAFGLNAASAARLAKGKLGLSALRYWLFNSPSIDRLFGMVKMGWITNPANMTRNFLDEYLNLAVTGQRHRLARGRQIMRDANLNHEFQIGRRFVALTNHRIPRSLRMGIRDVSDAMRAIHTGKLRSMGSELSEQRVAFAEELNDEMVVAEIGDALGGRTVDNVDESLGLGHAYAQEAHKRGLPLERFEYQGHKLIDRDGAHGLGALANNYGQRFLAPRMLPKVKPEYKDEILEWANNKEWDEWERTLVEYEAAGKKIPKSLAEPKQYQQVSVDMARRWHEATGLDSPFVFRNAEDSPANGVLAYIMWHHAIDNPEFMDSLDDDSKWLLEQFFPNAHLQGDIPGGALSLDEFKDSGKTLYHGTGRKFDQFQASRDFSNTGRGVNEGVYFTADPKVANTFAWVHKGIEEAPDNFFDKVDEGLAYPGVTPELVERLRQARQVAQDIRDGKTVYSAEPGPAAAAPSTPPAEAGWVPPKQGDMRGRISEIRKLKGDERIAAQRQLVEDMRAEWARGGIEFLNAPESGTNSRWIDNLSNDFNDYLRFDNMMDNQHLGALQKLKNKADDAAKAAGVVKDSADDTTSLDWTQGMAKLASQQGSKKIPLKDQPENRLSILKVINAMQGNRINLDDPKVQAIINDTSRKSPEEFSRFVHNSWVTWNVNAKREAFLATKGKAPEAPAPAAAGEPITKQEAMAAERAAEADVMKAMLRARIERGAKAKVDYDSVNVKTNKRTQIKATIDSPEQLDELDPVVFNEPEFWTLVKKGWEPRVIEAKVYGRTIDLRDPKKFPDDLRAALKEEKRWDPEQLGGSATYAHERSRALIEWMRANGYSKAHLLDSPESGGESYLVLPEMIEHNRDVVGEYAQKLADHVAANPPTPDDLAEHLRDPRFARMRRELEHYNVDEAGNRIDPADAEALDKALVRMIPKYIEDITRAVTGQNEKIDPELAGMLLRGEVPDQYELKALGQDALPPMAIAAQYGSTVEPGSTAWVLDGMTAKLTRWYDGMVTKPIRAFMRAPLYTDMYTTARVRTQEYADMLVEKHGWNREVADELAKSTARKQAMIETLKFVDNPKVASQFSQMSRNWWSFFRAQEDWLRRFGRAIKANPVAIRKAQLGIMGAEEVGILDRDSDGHLMVTYPFTGAAVEAFLHIAQFIGWQDDSVKIPNVPDLQTRLTFMSPSLNNPLAYSATPMVSLPLRFITAIAPGGELMDAEIDRAVNGELGAGRRWYEQMLPPAVMRLAQLADDDWNTGSKVGSATATAMQFMALNGTLEQYSDTAEDRARLLEDLQIQSKNILVARQAMAFVLPGAPGMAQVGEDEFGVSSKAYQEAGIMTLKDEFRQMAGSMGYGPALRLWAELYPNALAFVYGTKSETAAPQANAPITLDAASFVSANRDFFTGKYQSVAPYFLPEQAGEFDQVAWNSMLRSEVRQYKDLDEFFIDLATANGISEYYRKQDAHEALVKEARMEKNADAVTKLNADWEDEKKLLHVKYPTLDDWMDQGTIRARGRLDRIERLKDLVADPDAPALVQPQLHGITQMLRVYEGYKAAHDSLGTSRSASATAAKQDLANDYHDAMQQIIKEYPSLEDAYNGLFRLMVEQE